MLRIATRCWRRFTSSSETPPAAASNCRRVRNPAVSPRMSTSCRSAGAACCPSCFRVCVGDPGERLRDEPRVVRAVRARRRQHDPDVAVRHHVVELCCLEAAVDRDDDGADLRRAHERDTKSRQFGIRMPTLSPGPTPRARSERAHSSLLEASSGRSRARPGRRPRLRRSPTRRGRGGHRWSWPRSTSSVMIGGSAPPPSRVPRRLRPVGI